jgi:hypothetical protein
MSQSKNWLCGSINPPASNDGSDVLRNDVLEPLGLNSADLREVVAVGVETHVIDTLD